MHPVTPGATRARYFISAMGLSNLRGGRGRARTGGGRFGQRGGGHFGQGRGGCGSGQDGRNNSGRGHGEYRRTFANSPVDISDPHRNSSSEEWDCLGIMDKN
jgi:hypothetical protein